MGSRSSLYVLCIVNQLCNYIYGKVVNFNAKKCVLPKKLKKNVYRETGIRFLGKQIIVILR